MAQFEQHFVQDLTQPIKVRHCGSIVFNADNESNVVSVRLFNGSEPVAISGSVVGAVVCSDGATVPLTGSYSGNTASITLTGDCFAMLGEIGVGIQIVNGAQKTTVLKAKYNVETLTTENVVDPGSRITLEVGDLVSDIETATAAIPASDMASLMSGIAPTFSDSVTYKAGAYVYYGGDLYCFTADHNGGAWTGSDVTTAVLCNDVSDLKSKIESAFIISTASGAVACIADGADSIPFKTLTANIDSEQAPVSGWDEVNVTRAGKNLIDGSGIIQGGINEAGNWATNGKRVVTDYIRVNPGTEYVASIESGKAFVAYRSYDSSKQAIESANITTNPYTVPDNAHYVRIIFKYDDNSDIRPIDVTSAQLEVGHVATAYEPYTAQTISVDLETITGGTVYSGTLTINSDGSGVVVVDGSGEPVSYEFTASQFNSFFGDNSVWCDAGQVTVEYQADTKLYIDTKIAELQALVLENINS